MHEAIAHQNIERHIASALSGFVNELRLVDFAHYVRYVEMGMHDCLSDIVNEASMLFFSPGYLQLENVSNTSADWGTPASVSLNISINGAIARSFVNITILDTYAQIKLIYTSPRPNYENHSDLENFLCKELAENYLGKNNYLATSTQSQNFS